LDPLLTPFPRVSRLGSLLDPKVDTFCIGFALVNRSFRALSSTLFWGPLLDPIWTHFWTPLSGGDPTRGHFMTLWTPFRHLLATFRHLLATFCHLFDTKEQGYPLAPASLLGSLLNPTLGPSFEVTSGPHFGTLFWCHFVTPFPSALGGTNVPLVSDHLREVIRARSLGSEEDLKEGNLS